MATTARFLSKPSLNSAKSDIFGWQNHLLLMFGSLVSASPMLVHWSSRAQILLNADACDFAYAFAILLAMSQILVTRRMRLRQ